MKKASLLLVFFVSASYAQGIKSYKIKTPTDKAPLGSTCYDVHSQMMVDGALDAALRCKKTLLDCRKWRNKYKEQIDKRCDAVEFKRYTVNQDVWTKNSWFKVVAVSLVSAAIGAGVGLTF